MEAGVPTVGLRHALFLDLDGTLVDFCSDPAAVRVSPRVCRALQGCSDRLGGALAIVTGRSLSSLDECLVELQFPAAGLHGIERRPNGPRADTPEAVLAGLQIGRARLQRLLESESQAWLEDKGLSLALHFRAAIERSAVFASAMAAVLDEVGPAFRILRGDAVFELLPREASKGSAVRAFMAESPFAGRQPVFVGDDVTDLDGFAAARDLGGFGIAVGDRVEAEYRLRDVPAVNEWLERVNDQR